MTTEEPIRLPPRQSVPSRPRDRRRIVAVLAMILILGLAAWLLFLRPDGAAGPPETELTPTPSAAPSLTPVVDPQMGDDPVAAFRAIYAKRTLAISERRPEVVDEIYRPDCGCYELKAIIQRGTAAGEHHRDYSPSIVKVIDITKPVPGLVTPLASLRVITEQGPYTIEDDQGNVIDRDAGWAPQSTFWSLVKSQNGRWLVNLLDVEGTAEEILGPDWRTKAP